MKHMDDVLITALLWGVSVVPLICLSATLGYFYCKDREKRKLMFAIALGVVCFGHLYKMLEGFGGLNVIEHSFVWASFPLLSAVAIAGLSGLLKLKSFDTPFKLFLFLLGVWFTAMMLATFKHRSEENMASFFVLKKEIASAKRKFNMLFNLMPDQAVIVDESGNFLEVSDRMKEVSGY